MAPEAGGTGALRHFATLREASVARQKEWDKASGIDLSYRGNELAGEVGEACNIIKKLERERLGIRGSRATVQQLADELADVIICAALVAIQAGIDLDAAVASKFNATSEKVGLSVRLSPGPRLFSMEEVERALMIAEIHARNSTCLPVMGAHGAEVGHFVTEFRAGLRRALEEKGRTP